MTDVWFPSHLLVSMQKFMCFIKHIWSEYAEFMYFITHAQNCLYVLAATVKTQTIWVDLEQKVDFQRTAHHKFKCSTQATNLHACYLLEDAV